jgi:hypothetical protein
MTLTDGAITWAIVLLVVFHSWHNGKDGFSRQSVSKHTFLRPQSRSASSTFRNIFLIRRISKCLEKTMIPLDSSHSILTDVPFRSELNSVSSCILINFGCVRPQSGTNTVRVLISHGDRHYLDLFFKGDTLWLCCQ